MTPDQCTRCLRKGHLAEDCKWPACEDCTQAMTKPVWGGFKAGCMECMARGLSHGILYFEAAKRNVLTPTYKSALIATFGDGWSEGHKSVKAWAERIQQGATV